MVEYVEAKEVEVKLTHVEGDVELVYDGDRWFHLGKEINRQAAYKMAAAAEWKNISISTGAYLTYEDLNHLLTNMILHMRMEKREGNHD